MSYKYLFFNDYSEGAHPQILEALQATNLQQESGYGEDSFSREAAELIKKKIKNEAADIHFVSGGTQANLLVLGAILKTYESVIAASTAHIAVHEAGSIEATGHKINIVETKEGKLAPEDIRKIVAEHDNEHMVKPRVVFVSQATELGTLYTKEELKEISNVCKELDLYLYLDGARLGSALAAAKDNLSLAEIANLADIFYIGGTKNGALLGEAIVITNDILKDHFRYHMKQRGALLAKGRVVGLQFRELFKEDLFIELGARANTMAEKLTKGIVACGYSFSVDSKTNQIFPILPNKIIEQLKDEYGFYVWLKVDADNSAIRLVTSWATTDQAVEDFIEDLKRFI